SGTEASADRLIGALQSAFEDKGTAGVVLRINSPGGSPVQAGMVNDEIHRLRKLHPELPVYAVVEDTCASGAYYIAVAADRIYVDKASMVGSIGVLMDGFGFTGLMGKLGVERRLLTAGENKGMLDSFSPQSPHQLEHVKEMLGQIHAQFIAVVRQGRGERLQEKEHPELFSGLIWTGERSLQLGLADDYGTVESVARDVIKEEALKDFTLKENLAERVAQRFGASMTESMGRGAARVLERVGLR
ncbi:MAG: S49 family peptidase, partial [Rhodocyclales bacterium]|nr:S49 family peptidase [Rhodocyclales bacterium]